MTPLAPRLPACRRKQFQRVHTGKHHPSLTDYTYIIYKEKEAMKRKLLAIALLAATGVGPTALAQSKINGAGRLMLDA